MNGRVNNDNGNEDGKGSMTGPRAYAVGVGPGSPAYITRIAEEIIRECSVVVGYEYTLGTIRHLISSDKQTIHTVTMSTQEDVLQQVSSALGADQYLVVPFTGDSNFSESEVTDRLAEIFGSVKIIPGISSIQVAAAAARVPLDKARIITMHVTSSIKGKKQEMRDALAAKQSVILIPRPWPRRPDKHFMPSEVATHLKEHGFETESMSVCVFENLTTEQQTRFDGTVSQLEGKEFSDMCVMVIGKPELDSYINYRWQWDEKNSPEKTNSAAPQKK